MTALVLTSSHVYLIVAIVLCVCAAVFAGWAKEPYRALIAVAVGAIALALLVG